MTRGEASGGRRWRVAVARDEEAGGRLAEALDDERFTVVPFPVMREAPPADSGALASAAAALDGYHWVVCASTRAVRALRAARGGPWPRGVRTAAVGPHTAEALRAAGADPAPVVAARPGAEALWERLHHADQWRQCRVLVPTVAGGLRILTDHLRAVGATVDEVEAYRMVPIEAGQLRLSWLAAAPDAVFVASPSAARAMVHALGADALAGLRAVVAIGSTTAAALAALGVAHIVSPGTEPHLVARHLAAAYDAAPGA